MRIKLSLTAPTRYGDQMLEAYSNIGQTYVVNALINVTGSLGIKYLCIRLALDCALATVLLICVINMAKVRSSAL